MNPISDDRSFIDQPKTSQPKKPYSSPELVTYGHLHELTRGGLAQNPSDIASNFDQNFHPSK